MSVKAISVACLVFMLLGAQALLAQTNPVPWVNQPLVPGSAQPGGGAFSLTVNGTNFVPGATVKWNGSARTTTYVSSSQLVASILDSDIATAGIVNVTVANPGGTTSFPDLFDITVPTSAAGFAQFTVATVTGYITNMLTGDFNGDGKADFAVSTSEGPITVLLGNGDGTFHALPPFTLSGLTNPQLLLAADLNNDGKLDLLVVGENNSSLTTLMPLLGNGDGTFQPKPKAPYNGPGAEAVAVAADFNRDGNLDLAYLSRDNQIAYLEIQLGNGDGTFQNPVQMPNFAESAGGIAVGDFNQDGNLDLALAGFEIAFGNGDGTFSSQYLLPQSTPGLTAAADFNNDGILDVVENNGNAVGFGLGSGTFAVPLNLNNGSFPANNLTVADVNGDGIPDVINSYLSLSNGDGTFKPAVFLPIANGDHYGMSYLPADYNGDGRLDLASLTCSTLNGDCVDTVALYLQTTAQISTYFELFGDQFIGTTSAPRIVTLTNVGTSNIAIDSVSVGGADPADFVIASNDCGAILLPGANCSVSLLFSPILLGNRSATVIFTDGAVGPQSARLTGVGMGTAAEVQTSPTSLTFPAQPVGMTSPAQIITVTNPGNDTLIVGNIDFVGADPADFASTSTCLQGGGISPGSSCQINVTFTPGAAGARSAILQITDNGLLSPQSVPVSGAGVVSAGLVIASGSSSSATVTTGATASYMLQIGGAGLSGTATIACSGAPAGAVCTVPGSESVSATTATTFPVSVTTTARSSSSLIRGDRMGWMWATLLLGIVVPVSGRKKRWLQRSAIWLPLLLMIFITSCGGGSSGGSGSGSAGTAAGTYSLTVTATLNGTTQTLPLSLIVK